MIKYRPKGWKNPYPISPTPSLLDLVKSEQTDATRVLTREAFEIGADAMLDALRNNQWCPYDNSVMSANFKGKVVIIPDEE